MIRREHLVQDDGAVWSVYGIEGGTLTLTEAGEQLVRAQPEIWRHVRDYRRRIVGHHVMGGGSRRELMGQGDHAKIYYLTDSLVVKESDHFGVTRHGEVYPISLTEALQRMDTLYSVIRRGHQRGTSGERQAGSIPGAIPRWFNIPAHYGVIETPNLSKQYMLMQCIDSGITLEDFLRTRGEMPYRDSLLEREFGPVSQHMIDGVHRQAYYALESLREALELEGLDPEKYLPDVHQDNILVEQYPSELEGCRQRIWLIDQ